MKARTTDLTLMSHISCRKNVLVLLLSATKFKDYRHRTNLLAKVASCLAIVVTDTWNLQCEYLFLTLGWTYFKITTSSWRLVSNNQNNLSVNINTLIYNKINSLKLYKCINVIIKWMISSSSKCSAPSLQAQEPSLHFLRSQVFHRKLRN